MATHEQADRPFGHLLVVDLGCGMAAALVAKLLADFGARVVRVEPAGGDPFHQIYPAHGAWRARIEQVEADQLADLLQRADVCITGGENFPGLHPIADAQALRAAHPRLVVVDMGSEGDASGRSVDLLAQARTGLVHEQLSSRPICFAAPLPTYGATLLGLIGLWSALLQQQRTGRGELVRSTLDQGVGVFWSPFWMQADHPDAAFSTLTPKDCRHLIFECADGSCIQLVMGIPGAVTKLYRVLGIDTPADPNDRGAPRPGAPIDQYFGNLPLIGAHVRNFDRTDLLGRLRAAGLAAEPVLQPGECWDDPQVLACGLIETDRFGLRSVGRPFELSMDTGLPHVSLYSARTARNGHAQTLPLSGVRIVDLGNFVAGPFASRLLGDLGADVIKVEPPAGATTISGFRTVYSSNCNKRSLCVDLKTEEGTAILAALCRTADVVHHNFRVGVAERLGVAPAQLRAYKHDLITLETTAYGAVGPKRLQPGFDMVLQALCGHEVRAGGRGNPAMWIRSPLVDYATGALGAVAILMALYQRERTGRAANASVSLLSTALFLQSELIYSPTDGFIGAPLLNREVTGFHPAEALYPTRTGWIAVAARDDAMAGRFAVALGLPSLPAKRSNWGPAEQAWIAEATQRRDRPELLRALQASQVWAEACVEDGWHRVIEPRWGPLGRRATVVKDARYGNVRGLVGTLVEFGDAIVGHAHLRPAPNLGEHSRELLLELGYGEDEITSLIARQVCRVSEPRE